MSDRVTSWYDVSVVAFSLFVITLSANLQIPLYPEYASAMGYGSGFIALIFSIYVIGLIPVLIVLGGISDRIGQKRSIVIALCVSLLSNGLISVASSVEVLFVVRALQGVAVAIVLGASAAYLANTMRHITRAANLHGALVSLGLGSGALLTSWAIALWPWSAPGSYYLVSMMNLVCIGLMLPLRESVIYPQLPMVRLPIVTQSSLPFCGAIFLMWSLVGVVIALVPPALKTQDMPHVAGIVVFLAVATGAFFQPLCRHRSPHWALKVGWVTAVLAYFLLLNGMWMASPVLMLCAAALTGASGLGFVYIGGLRSVMNTEPVLTSRAVSGYLIFGYAGLGLPCVGIGYLVDTVGEFSAIAIYGVLAVFLITGGYIVQKYSIGHRTKAMV